MEGDAKIKGFRVSRSKTEYMECKISHRRYWVCGIISLDRHEIYMGSQFKYLGLLSQTDGETDSDVNNE